LLSGTHPAGGNGGGSGEAVSGRMSVSAVSIEPFQLSRFAWWWTTMSSNLDKGMQGGGYARTMLCDQLPFISLIS